MEIEYDKERVESEETKYFKEKGMEEHREEFRQALIGKLKKVPKEYRKQIGDSDTDPDVYKDLLYQLAKVVRNVEGKGPSSTGPEIGQLLCKLRCLDGERYDKEVLLVRPKLTHFTARPEENDQLNVSG